MTIRTKLCSPLLALSIAMTAGQAAATVVLPQNLEQLEAQAQLIFVGACTTCTATIDEHGMPVAIFTFRVIEPIKGDFKKTSQIEVRQFGSGIPNAKGFALQIAGLPTYPTHQKVVLFLNPPSKIGLTAPVGLWQGLFHVERDAEGREGIRLDPVRRKLLVSKVNTAKYLATGRLKAAEEVLLTDPPEWVELTTFCSLIRKIIQERERTDKEP